MKAMKKLFNAFTLVQLAYCTGCVIVAICMCLYTAFYPVDFADLCFRTGVVFLLLCTIPWGLCGTAFNIVALCITDLKKSVWAIIWTVAAPISVVLGWFLAVCMFVAHSGGV